MLTQAVRGKGLFTEPLPLCIVANYPSWDRFAYMVHPRAGIRSLADVKAKRLPLRISTREDTTHSTRRLDQSDARRLRLLAGEVRNGAAACNSTAAGRQAAA